MRSNGAIIAFSLSFHEIERGGRMSATRKINWSDCPYVVIYVERNKCVG